MTPEAALSDDLDAEAEAAADAEGLADLDAGRVIGHEAMKAWLLSWGAPDELPPLQVGDRSARSDIANAGLHRY